MYIIYRTAMIRIVWETTSQTTQSWSLAEWLSQTGPNDTPVKFCWHTIGLLTANIKKAFVMVEINEADRVMLRFLCFKNPVKLNSEIQHLRFTRLVFGLGPSPAILSSPIWHHLDAQVHVSKEFKTELAKRLKNSLRRWSHNRQREWRGIWAVFEVQGNCVSRWIQFTKMEDKFNSCTRND